MYDLVCALGGGDDRKRKAVELLNQKQASYILFTGDFNQSAEYIQFNVLGQGIYTNLISHDTYSDAEQIEEAMKSNNFNSLTIVTSNYHIPRVKIIFNRELSAYALNYIGVPSPFDFKRVIAEGLGCLKALFTH